MSDARMPKELRGTTPEELRELADGYRRHYEWDQGMNEYCDYQPGEGGYRSDIYKQLADLREEQALELERGSMLDE